MLVPCAGKFGEVIHSKNAHDRKVVMESQTGDSTLLSLSCSSRYSRLGEKKTICPVVMFHQSSGNYCVGRFPNGATQSKMSLAY